MEGRDTVIWAAFPLQLTILQVWNRHKNRAYSDQVFRIEEVFVYEDGYTD